MGNIVLYDKAPNLLSVVSMIRWMFKGKKERYLKIIPPAGVSEEDIRNASRFGTIIRQSLQNENLSDLNKKLVDAGAVDVQPSLVMIEKRGIMFFRIWADFILKKGAYGVRVKDNPGKDVQILSFNRSISRISLCFIALSIIKPFRKQSH